MVDNRSRAMKLRLKGLSYRQIGEILGISHQRVQQITSPPSAIRRLVVKRAKGCCQDCGVLVGRSGHVHHKNSTTDRYNEIGNLTLLCLSCHARAHIDPRRPLPKVPVRGIAKTVPITVNIDVELKDWLFQEAKLRHVSPARCLEAAIRAWLKVAKETADREQEEGARE